MRASDTARISRYRLRIKREGLFLYLLLFAIAVRLYRGGLARYYDQALKCRKCAHDLRGTPTDGRGRGRCGECGTPFTRVTCGDE